jgi:hypothetical protein
MLCHRPAYIAHAYISPVYFIVLVRDDDVAAFLPNGTPDIQGTDRMKLSVVIEIADGECHLPQAVENIPPRYPGPLGTFVAQVASLYLRIPSASTSESCAQMKAAADCRPSLRNKGMKLDRSV